MDPELLHEIAGETARMNIKKNKLELTIDIYFSVQHKHLSEDKRLNKIEKSKK